MRVKVIAQRWAESRPQHVPDAEINWHPGSALGRQAAPAQALAMRLSTLSTLGPFLLPASSAHSLIQQAFADTDPARPVQLQPHGPDAQLKPHRGPWLLTQVCPLVPLVSYSSRDSCKFSELMESGGTQPGQVVTVLSRDAGRSGGWLHGEVRMEHSRQGEQHEQRNLQEMIGRQHCTGRGSSPWLNEEC